MGEWGVLAELLYGQGARCLLFNLFDHLLHGFKKGWLHRKALLGAFMTWPSRATLSMQTEQRKDGFLAKNPPNEITPKTLTHAHFALLADGSPAGGSQAKGGSYHKPRSR